MAPQLVASASSPLLRAAGVPFIRRKTGRGRCISPRVTVSTLFIVLIPLWRLRVFFPATQEPVRAAKSDPVKHAALPRRFLSFQVCNGFDNQRLSIIAKETGRSLYLPMLLLDGTQHDTSQTTTSLNSKATRFSTFYDVDAFLKGTKAAGIPMLDTDSDLFSSSDQVVRVPSQDLQSFLPERFSGRLLRERPPEA